MTVYGFNKPKAEILSRHASMLAGKVNSGIEYTGQEVRIAKVPDGETLDALPEGGPTTNAPSLSCEQYNIGGDPADDGLLTQASNNLKVYNTTSTTFEAGKYLLVVKNETKWMAVPDASSSVSSVQFRLKSGWTSGTGVSTATSLTPAEGVAVGSELTVKDFKKLFQNAVGSDEQTEATGGSIGWATKSGSDWIVTQCTQKINRYEATIANGICTGLWGENLVVTNPVAQSVWPYTDSDPSLSGTGDLDVVNIHGLAANGGKVWIEFQQIPTATQDPTNSTVPYDVSVDATSGRWVITDVEFPVANYIQCMFNGTAWDFSQGNNVYDGEEPDTEFTTNIAHPDHLKLLGQTGGSVCLDTGTMGLARLDRSASGGGSLKYFVCMTSSSLNGEAYEAAIAGTLSPSSSNPPNSEDIIVIDGCEVKYKRIGKTFVFGNQNDGGSCDLSEQTITEPFLNWEDLDVIGGVNYSGGGMNFERYSIKSCTKEETTPIGLGIRNVDFVTDVYCDSANGFVKDTRTLSVLTATNTTPQPEIGVSIDTSCIEIDYTQIVNYPVYPYIDYYDIIYPEGCNPCTEESGCCVLTLTGGGTEQITDTSEAYCQSQYDNRDDVAEWGWASGECTGCCDMTLADGGRTFDHVGEGICLSRDNVGYIDPPTGKVVTNVNWYDTCNDLGCCDGGTQNGSFTLQATCVSGGGVWNIGVECPTGCCVAAGTPVDGMIITEVVCDEYSGTWYQGQNCTGNSFGCCVILDSSNREVAVEDGITDPACSTLLGNTPLGSSKQWTSGATCSDNSGCCVGGTYDAQQVLEGVCIAAGGTSWTQGPCTGGGGDDECAGSEVSSFYLNASGGSCTATFTQTALVSITGSSATISGTWDYYDGVLPQLGVAGSVILTKSGTNWNVSADIDGTINTTVTGTTPGANPMCESGASGSVTGPPGDSPCNVTWNGTFTFSLSL